MTCQSSAMPKKPKRTEPRHRSILAPQIQVRVAQIKAKEQRDKAKILAMKDISPFASSYLRKIEAREEVEPLESLGLTGQSSAMPKRKPVAELNRLVARLAAAPDRASGDALRQQILDGFYGRRWPRKEQRQYLKSLKEAEGGAYTSAEYEQLADITRQALKRRRDSFTVVYWTDAKGYCWYPKWQFDGNNQVLPEVRAILELLHTHDTWHALTTFLVPAVGDIGQSPLDLIRAGRGAEAIAFVRNVANER